MLVSVAKLPDQALLDDFLISSLVIGNVQGGLLWDVAAFSGEGDLG